VWVHADGWVFVADRECDRIQTFGSAGEFLGQWTDVQRPTDVCIDREELVYASELAWRRGDRSFVHGLMEEQWRPGRVSGLDPAGKVLTRWGVADLCAPRTLCLDSDGDLDVGEITHTLGARLGHVHSECHTLQRFVRADHNGRTS
jgi:hypothetical protein